LADSLANLQRPSQAGTQVSVVSGVEQLQDRLLKIGVNCEKTGEHELRLLGDAVDLSSLWQASQQTGVLIQRIEPAKNSLEQMFLDAVRGG
jgi:hypothetical protein